MYSYELAVNAKTTKASQTDQEKGAAGTDGARRRQTRYLFRV